MKVHFRHGSPDDPGVNQTCAPPECVSAQPPAVASSASTHIPLNRRTHVTLPPTPEGVQAHFDLALRNRFGARTPSRPGKRDGLVPVKSYRYSWTAPPAGQNIERRKPTFPSLRLSLSKGERLNIHACYSLSFYLGAGDLHLRPVSTLI